MMKARALGERPSPSSKTPHQSRLAPKFDKFPRPRRAMAEGQQPCISVQIWPSNSLLLQPVDERSQQALDRRMARTVFSLVEAKQVACDPTAYLMWVKESDAARFAASGWIRLEPPREGAVLFLHRERQQAALGKHAGGEATEVCSRKSA